MDIIRRNTDYALGLLVCLAQEGVGELRTAGFLSKSTGTSFQLTSKLMQKLCKVGIAASIQGTKGGFQLVKAPEDVNVYEVVCTIQGPITVNKCTSDLNDCPHRENCPMTTKMQFLQGEIVKSLTETTLADFIKLGGGCL